MAKKFITVKWPIEDQEKILETIDRTIEDCAYLTEGAFEDESDPAQRDLKFFMDLRGQLDDENGKTV